MRILAAILLAAGLAYALNRWAYGRLGVSVILLVGPVAEELLKTGLAVMLSAALWPVHFGFGFLEAVSDLWQRPRKLPQIGYIAALGSLVGHGAFGAVTLWAWSTTDSLAWGLIAGIGLHLLWNMWVVQLVRS